jgi:hypothetical protein
VGLVFIAALLVKHGFVALNDLLPFVSSPLDPSDLFARAVAKTPSPFSAIARRRRNGKHPEEVAFDRQLPIRPLQRPLELRSSRRRLACDIFGGC